MYNYSPSGTVPVKRIVAALVVFAIIIDGSGLCSLYRAVCFPVFHRFRHGLGKNSKKILPVGI